MKAIQKFIIVLIFAFAQKKQSQGWTKLDTIK